LAVTIEKPITLISGVYLAVPVAVTCPAELPVPFTTVTSEEIDVSMSERVGRSLATGFASVTYQSGMPFGVAVGTPLTCDGSPHTYVTGVFPGTQLAFHGGPAVASARVVITLFDPASFFSTDTSTAGTGPQSVS